MLDRNEIKREQQLRLAVHDVAVPEGLLDRLQRAVHEQLERDATSQHLAEGHRVEAGFVGEPISTATPFEGSAEFQPRGLRISRRGMLIAAAAGLGGGALGLSFWSQPLGRAWLAQNAAEVVLALERQPPVWQNPSVDQIHLIQPATAFLRGLALAGCYALLEPPRGITQLTAFQLTARDPEAIYLLHLVPVRPVAGLQPGFSALLTASGGLNLAAMSTAEGILVVASRSHHMSSYIRQSLTT